MSYLYNPLPVFAQNAPIQTAWLLISGAFVCLHSGSLPVTNRFALVQNHFASIFCGSAPIQNHSVFIHYFFVCKHQRSASMQNGFLLKHIRCAFITRHFVPVSNGLVLIPGFQYFKQFLFIFKTKTHV
jgi:hypothetical protein